MFSRFRNSGGIRKSINTRDANINNLDLNNDNHVDYISVLSYDQGQFYSIVLRVAVSSTEFQDVAVIEVSKNNSVELLCRSLGMRLYMVEIILYSYNRTETPNPGYTGNKTVVDKSIIIQTPLCMWIIGPCCISLSPVFSVYISPWHWGFYPIYYVPWTPLRYYNYWSLHYHYNRSMARKCTKKRH
jgi:hypothetical protein